MDNSIRNILKNAGKDPKEIKFQEEYENVVEWSKETATRYISKVVVEAIKKEYEADKLHEHKGYSVRLSISMTHPYKIDGMENDINDLIRKYNSTHGDGIYVYNGHWTFHSTSLIENLKPYGIKVDVSTSSIYAYIDAEKLIELIEEASNEHKKR